jgi:plastocyanin domain-containing protein
MYIKQKPVPQPLSGIEKVGLILPLAVVGYILWKFVTSKEPPGSKDYSVKDW